MLVTHIAKTRETRVIEFYDNGQIRKVCTFVGGWRHGVWREWLSDGRLWSERTYKEGELLSSTREKK